MTLISEIKLHEYLGVSQARSGQMKKPFADLLNAAFFSFTLYNDINACQPVITACVPGREHHGSWRTGVGPG